MGIERIMQYECRVCGRKIDVTRTGDVYEEPVYCCGLEASAVNVAPEAPQPEAPAPAVRRKPAKKKAKKKAAKKAKKAAKKAVKKKAKKKATKKKAAKKKATKKAKKKAAKRRR